MLFVQMYNPFFSSSTCISTDFPFVDTAWILRHDITSIATAVLKVIALLAAITFFELIVFNSYIS